MKYILVAGALCLATALPAYAKCGTNQLNGNWHVLISDSGVTTATILNGSLTITGLTPFPISQNSSCRVVVTDGGGQLVGSSESIAKSSSLKPRQIDVASAADDATMSLVRR